MAETKGEYIAVNELKGTVSTTAKDAVSVMYGSNKVRIAWAEGKRVWDVWETMLSANNFSISSSATTLTESLFGLQSYGTDRLGVKHQMTGSEHIEFSPSSITANTSTSSRTQNVVITQKKTGKSITVTATQAGNVQTTVYQNFRITGLEYSDVPAKGGYVYPTVYYSYDKVIQNSNGLAGTTTTMTGTTSSCTVTSYSTSSSYIGSVNTSNGSVYASSLYTTQKSRTSIALIYSISISVYIQGEYRVMTYSPSKYVYQQANTKTQTSSGYELDFYSSNNNMDAVGGSVTLYVTPYYVTYYQWTSGSDGGSSSSVSSSTTVSLQRTSGNGSLSRTSVTGNSTVTYTMYSNSDDTKGITHTIKASINSSIYRTVTITQSKGEYEFYFEDPGYIPYSGGTYNIELISRLNGKFMEIIEDTVEISEGVINSVNYRENSETYRITVTFPSNSSTSSIKTYTLTAQQYNTGKTTSITIEQAKKVTSNVTGSVSIKNFADNIYITNGQIQGFNSYPQFYITSSNGALQSCTYKFSLYMEVYTKDGNEFHPTYEYDYEYIEVKGGNTSETIYFHNFPTFINLEELIGPVFDPYFMEIDSVIITADITKVSGDGQLMLGGSREDYTWYVYN